MHMCHKKCDNSSIYHSMEKLIMCHNLWQPSLAHAKPRYCN